MPIFRLEDDTLFIAQETNLELESHLHVSKFATELEQVGILMNKLKMTYFDKEDVLYLLFSEGPQSGSLELTPDITAELNENGNLIGIEILNASSFIKDVILEGKLAEELTLAES